MFFNTIPLKIYNSGYKHCFLSVEEARYVASLSDIIIGIRSGIMDVVANLNSKIFCIYLPFPYRGSARKYVDANKVIKTYSLKQLPYVNPDNIYEYNTEIMNEDKILEDIVLNIKEFNNLN